jgi:hypothetical protein
LVYDYLDFSRAMEAFLNGIPAASIEALRLGAASLGAKNSNQVLYFDELMDSKALFLTGNTSTVYAIPFLDLKKDGPTVVEIPAGAGPGTVNDAYFRFVIDMGAPGPDKGKGGKYLILPPDYEGDLEGPIGGKAQVIDGETYFVAKSTSYVNWIGLRGFLVDGKPDAAAKMWRDGLKIYPLARKTIRPRWSSSAAPANRSTRFTPTISSSTRNSTPSSSVNPSRCLTPSCAGSSPPSGSRRASLLPRTRG